MRKALFVSIPVLLIVGFFALPVMADDSLVEFKGGIGVIPVSSGVGTGAISTTVNRNIVRTVQPAGQIWVIAALSADVSVDERITVDGRGLLLGGGNNIGTTNNQSVRATLICGTLPAGPFTLHSSGAVPLEPNGDFRIDDVLSPAPPNPCDNPVLLIRNPAGSWFAAGIPKLD